MGADSSNRGEEIDGKQRHPDALAGDRKPATSKNVADEVNEQEFDLEKTEREKDEKERDGQR